MIRVLYDDCSDYDRVIMKKIIFHSIEYKRRKGKDLPSSSFSVHYCTCTILCFSHLSFVSLMQQKRVSVSNKVYCINCFTVSRHRYKDSMQNANHQQSTTVSAYMYTCNIPSSYFSAYINHDGK